MFAVPGWSVSADTLKSETQSAGNSAPGTKTRKRKRANAAGGAAAALEDVTASTVADLWESVIEGKKSDAPKPDQPVKRQKKGSKEKVKTSDSKDESNEKKTEKEGDKEGEMQPKQKKAKKNKNQKKNATGDGEVVAAPESTSNAKSEAITKVVAPPAPKLTPLQASMREKLISARFRHLNETLYTRPSEESYNLFDESPEMFDEYHEGFRRQVKVWPENPVDSFLKDIRGRGRARPPGKQRPGVPPLTLAKTILPRTSQECTIADLGCGDARLAEALQADGKKLRVTVKSFDLQSPSPLVTKADIANLPLPDGSINVAVFCLALMGTNWVDFIEEAYRILHWKGELWVAEIKSRFGPIRKKNAPVTHSVGNRKKVQKGKGKGTDDGANDEDLSVEVDGMEDRRRETDVSAFVEVLKSRGFVLHGDREAIDLSNKMFVKMHFIKGAQPTKGKGVKAQEPPRGKRPIIRKIDHMDELPEVNEAAVLKPCVYKIR
ncbi:methyltransferase-domain-containing protein [Dactylonectria macrodidyma]|uniref:Ribosomal RNA-processing protein 8 n=1 Tax=Dactylonectria macrodidyma TaxID=307937 RepID=A0A9P9FFN9_9HYPO|nr:methyltransferase-domain-containing protein [Dactylonectria macrodidyma]